MAQRISEIKDIGILVEKLDKIFMEDGIIIPVDYDLIKDIHPNNIALYCHIRGMSAVVTCELCD